MGVMGLGWMLVSLLMVGVLGLVLWRKNPGIVDLFWALGILFLGGFYAVLGNEGGLAFLPIQWVAAGCVAAWALRLSGYLFWTRIRAGERDKRYLSLQSSWSRVGLGFFLNFQFQAILQVGVSTALFFLFFSRVTDVSPWAWGGILLFWVAFWGEFLADLQLLWFKATPENKGMVCNVGLWRLSRHPNYFFEWLIWVAFAWLSIAVSGQYWGVFSPVLMWVVFQFITGPLTEKESLKSRGELFRQYQRSTPFLFPRFGFKKLQGERK